MNGAGRFAELIYATVIFRTFTIEFSVPDAASWWYLWLKRESGWMPELSPQLCTSFKIRSIYMVTASKWWEGPNG